MARLEWDDFSSIPDVSTRNYRLTERQQIFLLSFLSYAENRNFWDDMDDADWDIVEAWLSNLADVLLEGF